MITIPKGTFVSVQVNEPVQVHSSDEHGNAVAVVGPSQQSRAVEVQISQLQGMLDSGAIPAEKVDQTKQLLANLQAVRAQAGAMEPIVETCVRGTLTHDYEPGGAVAMQQVDRGQDRTGRLVALVLPAATVRAVVHGTQPSPIVLGRSLAR